MDMLVSLFVSEMFVVHFRRGCIYVHSILVAVGRDVPWSRTLGLVCRFPLIFLGILETFAIIGLLHLIAEVHVACSFVPLVHCGGEWKGSMAGFSQTGVQSGEEIVFD